MESIITDLRNKFHNGNIVIQLIYLNVFVFLITALFAVIGKLFNFGVIDNLISSLLALPASLNEFVSHPWTIVTYMFVHAGLWHILFNMLCLYWFGEIFLQFFSSKHLRGLYLLGGIIGGVFFITGYNTLPYFAPMVANSNVVGASASVLAIVFAAAYREPNYRIPLFLLGNVRLKYLALATVVIDLLFITSSNAGGHIAHLGGALTGLAFAASLKRGTDLTVWINKIIDFIAGIFRGNWWHRKPKMKIHYNTKQESDYNVRKKTQNDEIDRILDKLKKSGYENLTVEEKKHLFDASKK
jgi:membrane associated rhomboid family serine protease